jgi:glycosyltransferase involved in cell wall biosynthesis
MPNVQWAFIDLPRWVIGKDYLKIDHLRVYYSLWQILALRAAKRLHQKTKFDVAHHITYGCYWRPSVLAYLGIPYVWGPVGGAQRVSRVFLSTMSWAPRSFAIAKTLAEWGSITFDPMVKTTARRAAIAVPTTPIGAERMLQLGAKKLRTLPQISLPDPEIEQLGRMPIRQKATPFRLISLGRLVGWKGIHLALQAFANFHREYPASEYIHVGEGPRADELRRTAHKLGVGKSFKIIEGVDRQQAFGYLAESDVLMFPSLYDDPGWVVIEAMAAGRPVIFVRGMPKVPRADQAGFKTRIDRPEHAVQDMSEALMKLAQDPDLRIKMGEAARQLVRTHYAMRDWYGAMELLLLEAAAESKLRRQVPGETNSAVLNRADPAETSPLRVPDAR